MKSREYGLHFRDAKSFVVSRLISNVTMIVFSGSEHMELYLREDTRTLGIELVSQQKLIDIAKENH
jgi:hypothetical protein